MLHLKSYSSVLLLQLLEYSAIQRTISQLWGFINKQSFRLVFTRRKKGDDLDITSLKDAPFILAKPDLKKKKKHSKV